MEIKVIGTILNFVASIGLPIIVEKLSEEVWKRIFPSLEAARKKAIKRMAEELAEQFPSGNFLEMNFRFDSPIAKKELNKLTLEREFPDEDILKKEMAIELSNKWPNLIEKSDEIVDTFLKYFEEECLASKELSSFSIVAIIKKENTETRQLIQKGFEETKESVRVSHDILKGIEQKFDHLLSRIPDERVRPEVITALEGRLIKERDELLDLVKKWQSIGLDVKVKTLAEEVFQFRKEIAKEISASIFRLCGSFILRSKENFEEASYWIKLAAELEPDNHKTLALEAELHFYRKEWQEAKEILGPIAKESEEPIIKIYYSECLANLLGIPEAFKWLKGQEKVKGDDEVQLTIANLAIQIEQYDIADEIVNKLKKSANPGPYPYLLSAQLLIKKITPREALTFSLPEDLEFLKNKELLSLAVSDLENGIKLLESTAKPIKEIAYIAFNLSKLYLALDKPELAEKNLSKYWRYLRKDFDAWFTASSLSFLTDKKKKTLKRAEKALQLYKEKDFEALFRFATICLNIEEIDKGLEVLNSIPEDRLDEKHLKAILQMKLICYSEKKDYKKADELIEILKKNFPLEDLWVLHKAFILTEQGLNKDAISLLESEKDNFKNSIKLKIRLARLYRLSKDHRRALPIYKEIANLIESVNLVEFISAVAFEANEPTEVIEIVESANKNGLDSDKLRHFRAVALSMDRQYDEAIELFKTFSEESLNCNDYVAYAFSHANKLNQNESINILKRAKIKFPDDLRIYKGLFSLYLETNDPQKAFDEAKLWLKKNPEDKNAYFAVINTGFAIGKQEFAHNTIMEYFSHFGEGPELRRGNIEDFKDFIKIRNEESERVWKEYQDGKLPEIVLARKDFFGIGCFRIKLLESSAKVMSFDGNPDSQKRQFLDTLIAEGVLIDYHALITLFLLDLFDHTFSLFRNIRIPEEVVDEIRKEIAKLSTAYQKDRRAIEEDIFSKVKEEFEIIRDFPQINVKEFSEFIGNAVFDLIKCKEKKITYVDSGFEIKDSSELRAFLEDGVISVLDLVDILKENGVISVNEYSEISKKLEVHKIQRFQKIERIPVALFFDWNALELLEECGVSEFVMKAIRNKFIGPFSYAVLNSNVENYKKIDDLQAKLTNLRDKIIKLIDTQKVSITPSESDHHVEETLGIKYINVIGRFKTRQLGSV